MRFAFVLAAFASTLVQWAVAYPRPPFGTEPIPQLMEKADLVCKGLVTSASPTTVEKYTKEKRGLAFVRVDRCFEGHPELTEIPVLFNSILQAAGAGPGVVLKAGDYYLFFLTRQSNGQHLPFEIPSARCPFRAWLVTLRVMSTRCSCSHWISKRD